MFKILIADDEKFIRKGIISILKRDLEAEVLCLEAENGIAAKEVVMQEVPDLIITDISMPGCDGLEFIGWLKAEGRATEVAILSGYENFEYAKQAMKYGVKDYIMKPVNKPEFLQLIRDYIAKIQKNRHESREAAVNTIKKNRVLAQVKQEALIGLLQCKSSSESRKYLDTLEYLDVRFHSSLFLCAIIQYEVTDHNREYMDFVAKNIMEEHFEEQNEEYSYLFTSYKPGMLILLLEGMTREAFISRQVQSMKKGAELIEKYGRTKVFIGIGDVSYDIKYLYHSFNTARRAVYFKIYDDKVMLCDYQDLDRGEDCRVPDVKQLLEDYSNNVAVLLNAFQELIDLPKSRNALDTIRNMYREVQRLAEQPMKDFSELFSFVEMKKELKKGITRRTEALPEPGEASSGSLMKAILYYIGSNLTKELDLNIVADEFSKSPVYISTLFRKSMGIGFNEYITNERMKIAMQLLQDHHIPIREVGNMCGYPNAKYFSVVFKKSTGKTPRQYREEAQEMLS